MREFPNSFKDSKQGIVAAGGGLTISFGPEANEMWDVQQVSIEMANAPTGATVELRVMGSLVDAPASAKKAAAAGDPSIFLYGGETMTVTWAGATVGLVGKVWLTYKKSVYA